MAERKPYPVREGERAEPMRHAMFSMSRRRVTDEDCAARGFKKTDEDGRAMYEVAIASESEIDRWFGIEILSHDKASVDLSRLNNGGAVLVDHRGDQVGKVMNGTARVDKDRVTRGWLRFSKSARGQEVEGDVADSTRENISVGYFVIDWEVEQREVGKDSKGKPIMVDVYRATRWQPAEVSLVSVPADMSVGVGRSAAIEAITAIAEDATKAVAEVAVAAEVTPAAEPARAEAIPEGGEPAKGEQAMKRVRDDKGAIIEVADTDPRPAVVEDARSMTQQNRDKEVAEIFELCDAHGVGGLAPDFVRRGLKVEEVSYEILQMRRTRMPENAPAGPEVDAGGIDLNLKPADQRRFSYSRAVLMAAGDVPENGFEAEVHQELHKKLRAVGLPFRGNGVLIPYDLRTKAQRYDDYDRRMQALATRALAGTGTGAEVIFDRPGELIELLRNRSVVISMGARVLAGLTGPVPFPVQDAAGTFTWVGENPGADVADSDAGLGLRTLSPKTGQSSTAYSRQLLIQASIDVENLVRNDLAAIHGLGIDRAAIHGPSVAGAPTGVYITPSVNSQDHASAVPTYALLVNQAALVADDNADLGALGWISTPLMAGKLKTVPEHATATMANWIWQGTFRDGTLAGYRAAATNQVSKTMTGTAGAETGGNDHGIIFGNWNDLIIGLFGALELVVDPYAKKKRGLIEVTSFQMADVLIRHAESFSIGVQARIA